MINKKAKEYRESQGISILEWNDIIDKLMEGYHQEQLKLCGVGVPKANSCICNEMRKKGVTSWWCSACKTDWV